MNCRYDKFLECDKSEDKREIHCEYCPHYDPPGPAQHAAQGIQRHQQYDYTEIEDRLTLKLDMLRDKLRDLTSAELKELESGLDAFTRMAELFLKRHGTPTEPERDKSAELGPCTTWTPDKTPETFQSRCEKGKNPIPLETDIDTVNFAGLIKLADKLGVSHNESEWLDDEWPDKEDELRAAVAEALEKVGK